MVVRRTRFGSKSMVSGTAPRHITILLAPSAATQSSSGRPHRRRFLVMKTRRVSSTTLRPQTAVANCWQGGAPLPLPTLLPIAAQQQSIVYREGVTAKLAAQMRVTTPLRTAPTHAVLSATAENTFVRRVLEHQPGASRSRDLHRSLGLPSPRTSPTRAPPASSAPRRRPAKVRGKCPAGALPRPATPRRSQRRGLHCPEGGAVAIPCKGGTYGTATDFQRR